METTSLFNLPTQEQMKISQINTSFFHVLQRVILVTNSRSIETKQTELEFTQCIRHLSYRRPQLYKYITYMMNRLLKSQVTTVQK